MKVLCILFSLIVVLLSANPCCTDSDCDTIAKTEQGSNNKTKDRAGCSPFFSCGMCAGFTVAQTTTANLLIEPAHTGFVFSPYQQPNVKEITLSIWQPPQLG